MGLDEAKMLVNSPDLRAQGPRL